MGSKRLKLITYLFIFLSCVPFVSYTGREPMVRVLLRESSSISFSSTDGFYVNFGSKRIEAGSEEVWTISKNSIEIGGSSEIRGFSFPVVVKPKRGFLKYRKRRYRGEFVFEYYNGKVLLINRLPLEEYLYGVVGPEIGGVKKEIIEAAKAQAVTARSYSMAAIRRDKKRPFDIYGDTRDQVYIGFDAETPLVIKAVDATRGYVLTYRGEPIVAYYHSTCGGITAAPEDVWARKIPYITSVKDTPHHRGKNFFCKNSPHFKWEKKIEKEKFLRKLLVSTGKSDARYVTIRLSINRRTHRVKEVIVDTDKGREVISGSRFRNLFGLKSSWFSIEKKGNYYIIKGRGYGHGTGMCQWGAREMAKRRYNFKKILKHYYPRSHIRRLYH